MKHFARTGLVVIAALAMSAVTLAAPAGAQSSSTPQRGGSVVLIGNEFPSFNPGVLGASPGSGQIAQPVYDTLVVQDANTGVIRPMLLKSLTGSTDALTWTFTLRPKVMFTDNTQFDSAALKYNFDYAANPANKHIGLTVASEVASWDVSNPLVAKATLKAPDAAFDRAIELRMNVVASPTAMAKYGSDYGTSIDKVVGAGPFTLTQWTRGSQVVYTRNPNYWDQPRPYLDTLTVKFITDAQQAFNTLSTGGADQWTANTPTADLVAQAKAAGMRVLLTRDFGNTYRGTYTFNTARPPFNDPIARQAMQIAVDPKKIAAAWNTTPTTTFYDKKSMWYSPKGTLPKYDPKKAQELINQWSAKNGGQPLTFSIPVYPGQESLGGGGEALQSLLSGYQNLSVKVVTIPASQRASLALAGNFDLSGGSAAGSGPGASLAVSWTTGTQTNYGKYSNPAMDAATKAGASTTVFKDRKKAYDTMQEIAMKDLPWWIMPYNGFTPNKQFVANKNLMGLDAVSPSSLVMKELWLKTKK